MTGYADFKLRAPTQAAAKSAATAALSSGLLLIDEAGEWITASPQHAFDPIGAVYNDNAVVDPLTGEITTPATRKWGWFANLRVKQYLADDTQAALSSAGGPYGVTIVQSTGRDWLDAPAEAEEPEPE